MTKKEITEKFGDKANQVIEKVRRAVKKHGTTWSAIEFVDSPEDEEFIKSGYRKYTTGEYVCPSYLNNFGWKNTYYQRAIARVYPF